MLKIFALATIIFVSWWNSSESCLGHTFWEIYKMDNIIIGLTLYICKRFRWIIKDGTNKHCDVKEPRGNQSISNNQNKRAKSVNTLQSYCWDRWNEGQLISQTTRPMAHVNELVPSFSEIPLLSPTRRPYNCDHARDSGEKVHRELTSTRECLVECNNRCWRGRYVFL